MKTIKFRLIDRIYRHGSTSPASRRAGTGGRHCIYQMILLLAAGMLCSCNHHDAPPPPLATLNSQFSILNSIEPTGNVQLDSLLQLAAVAPQDTNLVILYSKIGDMYQNYDFEKAKAYYVKSKDLSDRLDWNRGRYIYAVDFSNMLNREGFADSAIAVIQEAYQLAVSINDEQWKFTMLMNMGNSYFFKEWYEKALTCYMEGLPYLEKENFTQILY